MNKVITICSSVKNKYLFSQIENTLISAGYVPLLPVINNKYLPSEKLEATHHAKIDISDTVVAITPYDEITEREIEYALLTSKRVLVWDDIIENALQNYANANDYVYVHDECFCLIPTNSKSGRLASNTINGLAEIIHGGYNEVIKYADELR